MASAETARNRRRDAEQPWRRWYYSARWQRLREVIRQRDAYTCGKCGAVCAGKGQAKVDHRTPHRGDEVLFWDEGNIWVLCGPCHDSVKQAEEKGGKVLRRVGLDGYPV